MGKPSREETRVTKAALSVLDEMPCSLHELSRHAGLSVAALSRYKSGERTMRFRQAGQVLEGFTKVRKQFELKAERCRQLEANLEKEVRSYGENQPRGGDDE